MQKNTISLLLLLSFGFFGFNVAGADESSTLFHLDRVHEMELLFDQPDWWQLLNQNKEDEIYIPATFICGGDTIIDVGVRLKGNSSYWGHPGLKKPFKIKFSEYDENQHFLGVKTLNLHNSFKDPTMLRETIGYHLFRDVGPAPRTGFANLHVNGGLTGFYVLTEQVNKDFIERNWGDGEDGNLFKGDPHGTLEYKGPLEESYYSDYELKTNEEVNDWSDLVHFISELNLTLQDSLAAAMDDVFEIDRALRFFAMNQLLVNLDSYVGTGHNYYLYHREDSDRFQMFPWDTNETFGRFPNGLEPWELLELDLFWINPPPENRPLYNRLFSIDLFRDMYARYAHRYLSGPFSTVSITALVDSLGAFIRPHVDADPNKMYSIEEFDWNLHNNMPGGLGTIIFGLTSFVEDRGIHVAAQLEGLIDDRDLHINELMAWNVASHPDSAGEFDDWVELHNSGAASENIGGLHLTDDLLEPTRWELPPLEIPANGYLILWLDGDTLQGENHGPFGLSKNGEGLGLFDADGETLIDFVTFDALDPDISYGRYPDGSTGIQEMAPTPEAPNTPNIPPRVVKISAEPAPPTASDSVLVTAEAYDADGALSVVSLYWDAGAGYAEIAFEDDGLHGDGIPGDGVWGAWIPPAAEGAIVAYYLLADDGTDVRTDPVNAPDSIFAYEVEPPEITLFINEFMAINDTTIADPAGEFDDWIEIYNPGPEPVEMGGLFLSDDLDVPRGWAFPDTTLEPGGFMLVWADNDMQQYGLHASFKLSGSGEQVGLFDSDIHGNGLIDSLSFGIQVGDISFGRIFDGAPSWDSFPAPTPGASNGETPVTIMMIPDSPPIIIPPEGASFVFTGEIENRTPDPQSIQAWIMATLPDGSPYGPVLGPAPLNLEGSEFLSQPLLQSVPGVAPPGEYSYIGRVGEYPDAIYSESGFTFEKTAE